MDLAQLLSDDELRRELLERLPEVRAATQSGFESFDGFGAPDRTAALADDIERAAEGVGGEVDDGLEAIVRRFTRPVLMVQQSTFAPAVDGFPESEALAARLADAKQRIDVALPSVGRIDLRNHRWDWVGTGWMVAPDVAVTNRHVAENFAREAEQGFAFRPSLGQRLVQASIDWRREFQSPDESLAKVTEVLWMEPDGGNDVALLRVRPLDDAAPPPIPLMTRAETDASLNHWVAVVGYPELSSRNNAEDQQRIFDGVYAVKRLAPGTVMAIAPNGTLIHDATTLGGNSGSLVLDLDSGKAAGLHFGGIEGDRNFAVQAWVISDLLAAHG